MVKKNCQNCNKKMLQLNTNLTALFYNCRMTLPLKDDWSRVQVGAGKKILLIGLFYRIFHTIQIVK